MAAPPARHRLGSKAAALDHLGRAGLPIPAWFVVAPEALVLDEDGRARFARTADEWEAARIVDATALDDSTRDEIESAIAALCPDGALVAVRSSATSEDGVAHSFAGQFESYLCVRAEDVAARILDVWRSAFSPRVAAYRLERGLPFVPVAPAVLVQRMVRADSRALRSAPTRSPVAEASRS